MAEEMRSSMSLINLEAARISPSKIRLAKLVSIMGNQYSKNFHNPQGILTMNSYLLAGYLRPYRPYMVPGKKVEMTGKATRIAVDTASKARNHEHPLKISSMGISEPRVYQNHAGYFMPGLGDFFGRHL